MASEPESLEEPNADIKTDPPVLSECSKAECVGENDQEIENSTAPLLSPVNALESNAVVEVVSDPEPKIEHEVGERKNSSASVARLRSTIAKRKKARLQRGSRDVDGHSGSSGSVSRRTRKSERNPVLITLSSDSNSDSEAREKMSCSESEEQVAPADPPADISGKKRLAHVNAELIRKFSSFGWHRKEQEHKASDSSNNSADNKEKKNAKRKKQKTLASRAALMKRKYFKANTLRRSCVVAQSRILSPLKRGRPSRKLATLRARKGAYQNSYPTFLPKHREQQVIRPLGSKRGRPRKGFPTPSSSQNSFNNGESSRKSDDDENEDSHFSEQSSTQSCSFGVETVKKVPSVSESIMIPKRARGRPRLSDKEREMRVKKKKHPSTIINRKIKPVLQNESCFDMAAKLPKCRECRLASYNKSKKNQQSYCRFFDYRKLCFAKNGNILNAGFSLATDCTLEDMRLWLPIPGKPPGDLTIETSKALLVQVGDQFCDLIEQEREALSLHIGSDKMVTWKRIVQGVREMCDVCDTTLFNIHWVCPKCGLAICIDCYKVRKQGIVVENEESKAKGMDEYMWLLCNGRQPHEQEKLIMAQIVPGNALWTMRDVMHRARDKWKIAAYCRCRPQEVSNKMKKNVPTGICKELMCHVSRSFSSHSNHSDSAQRNYDGDTRNRPKMDVELDDSAMQWLTGVDDSVDKLPECDPCYESFASLKNMLTQGNPDEEDSLSASSYSSFTLDEIIESVIEAKAEKLKGKSEKDAIKLFNHRYPQPNSGRDPLPIRIFTTTESSMVYPDVPHSWLCNGRLLLLHQPHHPKNLELFQEQWKRGQPIMVMGVDKRLDMSLWHPDGFCRDFGEVKNDLVNCRTGAIIPNLPMRKFWEGFENFEKRMKDESGEYMLLKLKDWPPGEDFSEKLPTRFQDLMRGLPLPEYTHRDGIFNLAGRLPHWFVRPDLGPKMYNAYGSALYPTKGTTNLHLDVSDAVNVMVYVGVPHDGKDEDHILEALKAIDEGGCDSLMRERVRSRGVRPGALWHIYNARDADKIRDMLTKVAIERGEKLEAQHDPIHDQSWYIDTELRKRLYHEYGVEGYAIAQCLGDAVFIPAGAPHQVRNLHSCVKVAEDFVSPENIAHCFKLTQEFRHLSDTHTNHEDKLQIKNIIYHVVKDALSHLIDQEAAEMYHLINL